LVFLKKIILVAGTNGKGSTCAMLEGLLRKSGEKTGFYSSPHLAHYCERIRLDGTPISEELFTQSYEFVAKNTHSFSLTHFEVITLMALWVFTSGKMNPPVERIILEVGLGGRWDATNAVPHGVSVFTPIDFDHQNLLGSTLWEIAENKLDIVTPNSLNVHQPFPREIEKLVNKVKAEKNGQWIESPSYKFSGRAGHPPQFTLLTPWGDTPLPLAGPRGAENASLAVNVFNALGFDVRANLSGLALASWPARMDLFEKTLNGTPIYLSGDHNPHGIRSLISLLKYYPRKKLHIIAALGRDKDRDGILSPLFELPDTDIILTQTPFRYLPLEEYGQWLSLAKMKFKKSSEALSWVIEHSGSEDMILITGSLYLAGALMSHRAP
jgi:dihydrofolate synthase/folylpolyglutamate synthase